MGQNSKIEWTHHTFNPWWGCVKVSPGCANCYAESFSKRTGNDVWGKDAPRRFFTDKHWNEPLKWNREAEAAGERRRVFCASMADVFEDRDDLVPELARLFELIQKTAHLDWLLLTKRPESVMERIEKALCHVEGLNHSDQNWVNHPGPNTELGHFLNDWTGEEAPSNIWIGTSVEDGPRKDRLDHLRAIPAKVRFLSCEPLLADLGFMDLRNGINWVIVGGESGAKCRPFDPEWAREIRDQCKADGVAFFMKQMGGTRKPFPPIPDDLMIREFPAGKGVVQ